MNKQRFDFETGEILNFNKPSGVSSFFVVKKVRSYANVKKVGHAGTLDPFANGVLLICTGKATKRVSQLMELSKEYTGKIRFGRVTDTDDITGKILSQQNVPPLTLCDLTDVCQQFIGEIAQVPPLFSAKKVKGKRLYQLARKGEFIDRPPSIVTIYSIEIIDFQSPFFDFKVICSKGTYIRALARDIGEKLGCGAYLHSLTRIRIGNYKLKDSLTLDHFHELLN